MVECPERLAKRLGSFAKREASAGLQSSIPEVVDRVLPESRLASVHPDGGEVRRQTIGVQRCEGTGNGCMEHGATRWTEAGIDGIPDAVVTEFQVPAARAENAAAQQLVDHCRHLGMFDA